MPALSQMTKELKKWTCIAACTLLLDAPLGCASAPSVPARASFCCFNLDQNTARVGYHVSASIRVYDAYMPPGCQARPWLSDAVVLVGAIPPGMRFDPVAAKIEGTPRQPGTWRFAVDITNIGCRGVNETVARTFGNRRAEFTFTVTP